MTDLYAEITSFLADRTQSGVIVSVGWAATEFVKTRGVLEADDPDFWLVAAHDYVTRLMKKAVARYAAAPDNPADPQLLLPGFKHLQVAYTFDRGGEKQLLIPIDQLTDVELESRAAEYETMAAGCLEHAKELRAYVRQRTKPIAI